MRPGAAILWCGSSCGSTLRPPVFLGLLSASFSCARADVPPPHGIILVSMDTVRADATSPYGARAEQTPALSHLAAEGVVFERAFAQANETLFSHGSLFTGRIVSHIRPVDYNFTIPEGTPTIAAEMRAAGYRTGAVVAGGHLARLFGLDDGFDSYTEGAPWGSFQETIPMAVHWVDIAVSENEPFFLFVHGYDAHTPYVKPGLFGRITTPGLRTPLGPLLFDPLFYERVWKDAYFPDFTLPSEHTTAGVDVIPSGMFASLARQAAEPDARRIAISEADRTVLLGSYQGAVSYADAWLGVLLRDLEVRGLLATTTIAVVSDHGEALLEYGFFNHRHTLRNVSTHVPLVIRPAGGHVAVRVATPVSLLDVAPTLLEMAGASRRSTMSGRSLVACLTGTCEDTEMPYSEGAMGDASVTDGRYRLVVSGITPSDPDFDVALRTGVGASFTLYDAAAGEREDVSSDASLAPILARLRAGMLAARGASP